nr:hypothetical protein GCM10020063_009310 [Dactylosporangium thailandense]
MASNKPAPRGLAIFPAATVSGAVAWAITADAVGVILFAGVVLAAVIAIIGGSCWILSDDDRSNRLALLIKRFRER